MSEFDLVDVNEPQPDAVANFARGILKEGNIVADRIGQDLRAMKTKLFNRPEWDVPTLQQHVDAMGVAGVVMFAGSGFQSRIAAVLKRLPKDDHLAAMQILEGAKQALSDYLATIDPNYEQDPDIVPPVPYTVDTSSGTPRIVFDAAAEYPGPQT